MPGSFMPPVRPPTFSWIASSTLRPASFTAARTRSWSISTSSLLTASGSIFWGIFLIALGVLLIMANFEFLITYRTLGNFWPLAVIVVGLKLVYDAVAKSKKGN